MGAVDITDTHMGAVGITATHMGAVGITGTHMGAVGITDTHMGAVGITAMPEEALMFIKGPFAFGKNIFCNCCFVWK